MWTGRKQAAVALLENALKLDPAGRRSPMRQVIVVACFAAERYSEALAACERALAEQPMMHTLRAAILAQAGRLAEARQRVSEVRRLQPQLPRGGLRQSNCRSLDGGSDSGGVGEGGVLRGG